MNIMTVYALDKIISASARENLKLSSHCKNTHTKRKAVHKATICKLRRNKLTINICDRILSY